MPTAALSSDIKNRPLLRKNRTLRRNKVPRSVPVQTVSPEPVVKLAPEIQHLVNLVKMAAYQAESDLFRAV